MSKKFYNLLSTIFTSCSSGFDIFPHVARRHRKHPNQSRVPTGTRQQWINPQSPAA